MTNRESWITQIRANPSDWQAMLIFADWLEESGDLLSAEQWRFLAVLYCNNSNWVFHNWWPSTRLTWLMLHHTEYRAAKQHNIRCMPTYPTCMEDVERYYRSLETERALTVS